MISSGSLLPSPIVTRRGAQRFWEMMRLLKAVDALSVQPQCRGRLRYQAFSEFWTQWEGAPEMSLVEFVARTYFRRTFRVQGRRIHFRE